MGSKILIMELHKRLKNGIFIDIGSGLDYLCIEKYFQEILPLNWNNSCFDYIYEKAKTNIGLHL